MRKVLVSIFTVISLAVYAQKFNVETAAIEVKHYEDASSSEDDRKLAIERAKAAIDKAFGNPETRQDAKMWSLRGKIYMYIAINNKLGIDDPKALDVSKEAFANCIKFDNEKKKYANEAKDLIINVGVNMYNKAVGHFNSRQYAEAIHWYKSLTEIYPYDTRELLKSNNISEGSIFYYMGTTSYQAALDSNSTKEQKKDFLNQAVTYLQTSIDKNYSEPFTYIYLSNILLETCDTARALTVVEAGRDRFSSEPKLIEAEINIYIAQQRVDVLVKKLDVAIEANPDKEIYYLVRATSYQTLAKKELESIHKQDSVLGNLNKQLKSTADPKKKATLQTKVNELKGKADKSKASYDLYSANCEKDYKKALELNDGLFDAHYNLAAYYLDMAAPFTITLNDPNTSAKAYEDAEKAQAEFYKKALASFDAGLAVLKGETKLRIDVYYQMFKLYARINEPEKAKDYKNKYEELKKQYEAGEVK